MFLMYILFQMYFYVRFIFIVEVVMVRIMIVDFGDELCEFIELFIELGDYRM